MKNLFLCNTPYQVIVATQIAKSEYEKDVNDIIVTDKIADCERLYTNIEKSGVFNKVTLWRIKNKYANKNGLFFFASFLLSKLRINIHKIKFGKYDNLFCGNIAKVATILYRTLKQKKEVNTYLFEDGFSTYSKECCDFFEKINKNNNIKQKLLRVYRKAGFEFFLDLKGMYLFSPSILDWEPSFPVIEIEKIDSKNNDLVETYNRIFGIRTIIDSYSEKYIFFEESYFADSINIGDETIIKQIAYRVGLDGFLLKIHPRNPVNRFNNIGIKVNKDTSIPWEIIALNNDLSNKVLITIASGSALTSLVNTNIKPKKIIMLMNCEEIDDELLTPSLEILRRIAKSFGDTVWLPKSIEEVYEYFEKK